MHLNAPLRALMILALLIAGILLAARGDGRLLALAGLWLMAGACLREARRLRWMPDLLRPAFWMSGAYTLIFGLGGARLLLHDPTRHLELWLWILVGFGALLAGFRVAPRTEQADPLPPRRGLDRRRWRRVRRVMFLWLALGLFAAWIYVSRGVGAVWFAPETESARVDLAREGGAAWRLLMLGLIPWCWWAILDRRTGRILPRWFFLGGLGMTVLALVLTGNRAPLMMLGLVGVMVHLSWPGSLGRITARFWLRLGVATLLAGLIFGAWGAARLLGDQRTARYPEVAEYAGIVQWPMLAIGQTFGYVGRGAENLAVVMDAVPGLYPYRYGGSYLDPFWTMLPGTQFTLDMQLKQALDLRFAGGGFVPSMLGEAFVNFGYAGFVLVPFLLACVLATLFARWRTRGGVGTGLVYCLLVYYFSVHMVSGVLASSIILPWCVALLLLSAWLIGEEARA